MDCLGKFVDDIEDDENLVIDNVFEYIILSRITYSFFFNLLVMVKVALRIQ